MAEILINELKMSNQLEPDSSNLKNYKEEQNVRRRVYDALNVLIAADILIKKDKHVMSHDKSFYTGKS